MEKDWSTINVQRDQVFGRDSDEMRQRLLQHHDTVTGLVQSAPTEELNRKYQEVRAEIEQSIRRLDELSKSGAASPSAAYAAAAPSPSATRPGTWTNTQPYPPPVEPAPASDSSPQSNRTIILLILGLVALSIFGYLGWRYMKGRRANVVEPAATRPADTTDSRIVETHPAPVAAAATEGLTVTPDAADFGKVKKGTRIVKKFEIANNSGEPLNVTAGRSQCHCLWFQFSSKVAAGSKVPMTITLDGARARKGAVSETVTLKSKEHPEETSTIKVTATVE